ncbi:MAG: outer membrane protein assembly factor BamD [Polyangiaceae bacterium]
MRRVLSGILCVVALTCAAACEEPPAKTSLNYTADAKRAYDDALGEFNAHNWIESQTLMREVKRKYSYSKYARLAELRIADADFEQEKYAEAIHEFKDFVHDHRAENEESIYARSRIAEAEYKQINDSIILPAAAERDQEATSDAYKELRSFLHDYPAARQSPHICDLLEDVTIRLVQHEMYVARFYLNKNNFDAAVLRLQYALRNYVNEQRCTKSPSRLPAGIPARPQEAVPDTIFGLAPDALLLLGETFLKMHRYIDAKTTFDALVLRFPESGLVVPARNYLDVLTHENKGG